MISGLFVDNGRLVMFKETEGEIERVGRFRADREIPETAVEDAELRAAAETLRQNFAAQTSTVTEADIIGLLFKIDTVSTALETEGGVALDDEQRAFYLASLKRSARRLAKLDSSSEE